MDEHVDWETLSRYLAGESSVEEERQVESWLREDPEHRQLLADLRRIWEISEQSREDVLPTAGERKEDRERLLKSIREHREATASERPARRRDRKAKTASGFRRTRLVRMLAVVLILGVGLFATAQWSGWDGDESPSFELVETPRGERTTVRLADSTRVWLSVDTKLHIPTTFGDDKREVKLSGEAYFEVTPDPDRPFIVRSGPARVQVLGTAFGVDAYPGDSSMRVVVREGSVAVQPEEGDTPDAATLRQGELGEVSRARDRVTVRSVDVGAHLGWLDSRLDFNDAPLPRVADRIERWYDIEVRLQGDDLASRRLTASFDDTSAESVASVIAATLGIEYRIEDRTIIFKAR